MSDSFLSAPKDDSLYFSRTDVEHPFAAWSKHAFSLEDKEWPSVEHYFQAMKFQNEEYQEKIRTAEHPKKARKMGRTRFKKIRKDWKQVKVVYMTRALYTKCRTHPEIGEELLQTGDRKLVDSTMYDYFWGSGRDRRGTNMYGQVLMNVRSKLLEEQSAD